MTDMFSHYQSIKDPVDIPFLTLGIVILNLCYLNGYKWYYIFTGLVFFVFFFSCEMFVTFVLVLLFFFILPLGLFVLFFWILSHLYIVLVLLLDVYIPKVFSVCDFPCFLGCF